MMLKLPLVLGGSKVKPAVASMGKVVVFLGLVKKRVKQDSLEPIVIGVVAGQRCMFFSVTLEVVCNGG